MIDPPRWDDQTLEHNRLRAIRQFREQRLGEPLDLYTAELDGHQSIVADLLAQTSDLRDLDEDALLEILTAPKYREAFRYLAGPPISTDDWKVLCNVRSFSKQRLREDPQALRDLADVVMNAVDPRRFPWLVEKREPTTAERGAAILASACLWAHQRTQTARRSSGRELEQRVTACLLELGFRSEPPRDVHLLQDAPGVGRFCGECTVAGRRADLVVGLWDRRCMFIECKDSNSAVNSVKRLQNDTAAKASAWIRGFGEHAVVPVAVVSGVFYLRTLVQVQRSGLFLFWGHDLGELCAWLQRVKVHDVKP